MPNEVIFFLHLLLAGGLLLGAGRLGRGWLTALIVACTLMMNIVVCKQETLFGLAVTGGNILYATVFLANDVINEHYGRRAARAAVFTGFAAGLAVLVLMEIELWYAPNEFDDAQPHLQYFFAAHAFPRIVIVSMISYLGSQLLDTGLYQLIRARTGADRLLWLRSNASTWIAQAFDTVFFTTLALTDLRLLIPQAPDWLGAASIIHSWPEWGEQVLFAYIIKVAIAVVNTPFLYLTTWQPLVPPGSRGRCCSRQES